MKEPRWAFQRLVKEFRLEFQTLPIQYHLSYLCCGRIIEKFNYGFTIVQNIFGLGPSWEKYFEYPFFD